MIDGTEQKNLLEFEHSGFEVICNALLLHTLSMFNVRSFTDHFNVPESAVYWFSIFKLHRALKDKECAEDLEKWIYRSSIGVKIPKENFLAKWILLKPTKKAFNIVC